MDDDEYSEDDYEDDEYSGDEYSEDWDWFLKRIFFLW